MIVDTISEDTSYFYEALPYVMVLGAFEKWTKFCERLNVESPSWYVKNDFSNKKLNPHNIDKFISEFYEFFRVVFEVSGF